MRHWIIILAMTVMMPLAMACGGENDEPNGPNGGSGGGSSEKPDTNLYVPRNGITDGDGSIFIENGKMLTIKTDFIKSEMEKALTQIHWKSEYYIAYDKNYISRANAFSDPDHQIPSYIFDGTVRFYELGSTNDEIPRKYKTMDKGFIVDTDLLSSSWENPIRYNIIALELTDSTAVMVTDRAFPHWYSTPKGIDSNSLTVRIVWKSFNSNAQ